MKKYKESRLAWGVWVEIHGVIHQIRERPVTPRMRRVSWNLSTMTDVSKYLSHASHEACELKLRILHKRKYICSSRLAWGVWVEITRFASRDTRASGHASHEACELKFHFVAENISIILSRLARGVWVVSKHISRRNLQGKSIKERKRYNIKFGCYPIQTDNTRWVVFDTMMWLCYTVIKKNTAIELFYMLFDKDMWIEIIEVWQLAECFDLSEEFIANAVKVQS